MKISVIIPVYNAERYLEEAIDSVINQSLTDIEIILVNDGSTDRSQDIIDYYAAKDSRIVVINKRNEGVARARAAGVAVSKGDYIQTMDNDDYMYPNALEKLYHRAIETDADMVVGRSIFYEVVNEKEIMDSRIDFDVMSGMEYFSLICDHQACWATWTRLHKASIYRDQEILISPHVNRAEDVFLTPQLCYFSKKVVTIDDITMRWYIRPSSLSNRCRVSEKERIEFLVLPDIIEDYFRSKGLADAVSKEILKIRIHFYQELILRGVISRVCGRCRYILGAIKQHPEIEYLMAPRMVKILKTFDKYNFFVYIRLVKYKIKNVI